MANDEARAEQAPVHDLMDRGSRPVLLVGISLAVGLAACVAAIALSERCPGDPRFACGSASGVAGAGLWATALICLLAALALGVGAWRRLALAALLVAIWIGAISPLPDSFTDRHESLLLGAAIVLAVLLGVLLRFWAFALIPVLTLAVVPVSRADDADGTSPWVFAAIDSVVILTLPFAAAASLALWFEHRRALASPSSRH